MKLATVEAIDDERKAVLEDPAHEVPGEIDTFDFETKPASHEHEN